MKKIILVIVFTLLWIISPWYGLPYFMNELAIKDYRNRLKNILEGELSHQGLNQEQIWNSRELIKQQLGHPDYLFNPIKK